MIRRRSRSPLRSPVLVGALTVLVVVVSVVLAFGANNGLPFVPHYILHVQLANAEELVHGGEVDMGGALVGTVDSVSAGRDAGGNPIAVANLALNRSVEPLPVDTRFTVRLQGAIGTKFLEITLGHASRTWPTGATVPVRQTGASTDLDQVLDMFTPPTRVGVAQSTVGYGTALAGRGADLNDAIGALRPLVRDLTPVMANLAARGTDLTGFIDGLGAFTGALAPVARLQAQLFTGLGTTFGALAGVAPSLQRAIAATPPAFAAVTADSPRLQGFVRDTTTLLAELRPGAAALPASAPVLADAFSAGARTLPASIAFDGRLVSLATALHAFSASASDEAGIARLTLTAAALRSPLQTLTPAQTTCNEVGVMLRNVASTVTDSVGDGTVLRFVLVAIDDVPGGEAVPSHTPFLTSGSAGGTDHGPLHANPYPYTASPGQPAECAAGHEPYSAARAVIGNPSGSLPDSTESTR